jgi:hypothetical protein
MSKPKEDEETRCFQALESLAVLQHPRSTVDIRVDLSQGFSDEEEYEELLGDAAGFIFRMAELLNSLKMHGLNVGMTFEGTWYGRDGTKLCSDTISSLDECISRMRIACQ